MPDGCCVVCRSYGTRFATIKGNLNCAGCVDSITKTTIAHQRTITLLRDRDELDWEYYLEHARLSDKDLEKVYKLSGVPYTTREKRIEQKKQKLRDEADRSRFTGSVKKIEKGKSKPSDVSNIIRTRTEEFKPKGKGE